MPQGTTSLIPGAGILLVHHAGGYFYCAGRAMLCIAQTAVARCPSICLSITRWYSSEMAKYIIRPFHRQVATSILVFSHQIVRQYADADPLTAVYCRMQGIGKNSNFRPMSGLISQMV